MEVNYYTEVFMFLLDFKANSKTEVVFPAEGAARPDWFVSSEISHQTKT